MQGGLEAVGTSLGSVSPVIEAVPCAYPGKQQLCLVLMIVLGFALCPGPLGPSVFICRV